MGLYDGVGGILKEGSSYLLAKETKTPILLVVNAKGAGKSLVAQIMGMKMYDTEGLIRGIFLNRVSEKYYQVLKPCIETETGIRVVGFLPEMKDVMLGSRHLGLVTPDEIDNIQRIVQILSDEVSKHADMDAIIEIAGHAEDFQDEEINEVAKKTDSAKDVDSAKKCVIAVSKD
jgi:cobyrinic acid a,c-diamide synthase